MFRKKQGKTYRKLRNRSKKSVTTNRRTRKTYKKGGVQSPLPHTPYRGSKNDVNPPLPPHANKINQIDLLQHSEIKNKIRFPQKLKQTIINNSESESIFNSEEMVKGLGHKDYMNYIFDNVDENFRKTMEKLSASQQCKQTIGTCNNCKCWLCEEIITSDGTPECEHILPIARSILFSGIKGTKKQQRGQTLLGTNPQQKIMDEYFKLSYDYAHKTCNTIKSDIVLIKWDETTQSIVFDKEESTNLAKKIKERVFPTNPDKVDYLVNVYEKKINQLTTPINEEIKAILSLEGGTMDLFWAYTLEIMKSYVEYEFIIENQNLRGEQLEQAMYYIQNQDESNEEVSTENLIEKLREYRTQKLEALKSVKKDLKRQFFYEQTLIKRQKYTLP